MFAVAHFLSNVRIQYFLQKEAVGRSRVPVIRPGPVEKRFQMLRGQISPRNVHQRSDQVPDHLVKKPVAVEFKTPDAGQVLRPDERSRAARYGEKRPDGLAATAPSALKSRKIVRSRDARSESIEQGQVEFPGDGPGVAMEKWVGMARQMEHIRVAF